MVGLPFTCRLSLNPVFSAESSTSSPCCAWCSYTQNPLGLTSLQSPLGAWCSYTQHPLGLTSLQAPLGDQNKLSHCPAREGIRAKLLLLSPPTPSKVPGSWFLSLLGVTCGLLVDSPAGWAFGIQPAHLPLTSCLLLHTNTFHLLVSPPSPCQLRSLSDCIYIFALYIYIYIYK